MRRFISMQEDDGTTLEFGRRSEDTDADVTAAPWYLAMTPPGEDPEWQSVTLYVSTAELLGFLTDAARLIDEHETGAAERPLHAATPLSALTPTELAATAAADDPAPGPRPHPPEAAAGHGKT